MQRNRSIATAGGTIDGLAPNTEYAFQVAGINWNGTGPFSEPITLGGKPTKKKKKKKKKLIAMMAMYGTVSVCAAVAKV